MWTLVGPMNVDSLLRHPLIPATYSLLCSIFWLVNVPSWADPQVWDRRSPRCGSACHLCWLIASAADCGPPALYVFPTGRSVSGK